MKTPTVSVSSVPSRSLSEYLAVIIAAGTVIAFLVCWSAMELDNPADNAQPQANAAVAGIHAYKGFTQFTAHTFINAVPFILNDERQPGCCLNTHRNVSARWTIAMSILYQVTQ